MRLDRPELGRLLYLVGMNNRGRLDLTLESELRGLVAKEGYAEDSKAKDVRLVAKLAGGILMAYDLVEGVDIETLVA